MCSRLRLAYARRNALLYCKRFFAKNESAIKQRKAAARAEEANEPAAAINEYDNKESNQDGASA